MIVEKLGDTATWSQALKARTLISDGLSYKNLGSIKMFQMFKAEVDKFKSSGVFDRLIQAEIRGDLEFKMITEILNNKCARWKAQL